MESEEDVEALAYLKSFRVLLGFGILLIFSLACWFGYSIYKGYSEPLAYLGMSLSAIGVGRTVIEWLELNRAITRLKHWEYVCGKKN